MKADGGALFYIIIAVLSLIVSAISKSNNKKAAGKPVISGAPEEEETDEVPQNPWEKELQEIFGKQEPVSVPEKGPIRKTVHPDRDTVPEITGTQETMYAREAEKELKKYRGEISIEQPAIRSVSEDKIRSPKHAPEEEEPVFSSGFEEFDLRKAIIYNEVLNRKYI